MGRLRLDDKNTGKIYGIIYKMGIEWLYMMDNSGRGTRWCSSSETMGKMMENVGLMAFIADSC